MAAESIILMVLFVLVIWGGLVASVVMLRATDDDSSGELGTAPGTDNDSLLGITRHGDVTA